MQIDKHATWTYAKIQHIARHEKIRHNGLHLKKAKHFNMKSDLHDDAAENKRFQGTSNRAFARSAAPEARRSPPFPVDNCSFKATMCL